MITIFLGAGCSLPSGQPSTSLLTNEVLNGNYFFKGDYFYNAFLPKAIISDKKNLIDTNEINLYHPIPEEYQLFYNFLFESKYWNYDPTYEDLSGFIVNVFNYHNNEYNDIFTSQFINSSEFYYFERDLMRRLGINSYVKFYSELLNIIDWIIVRNIRDIPQPLGYCWLMKICNSFSHSEIRIATTNYDLNVENVLANNGIKFDYGFQGIDIDSSNGIKWQIGNKFKLKQNITNSIIPILKLHGSINWFDLFSANIDFDKLAFGIPSLLKMNMLDIYKSIINLEGRHIKPVTAPRILHGSMYKIFSYVYSLHIDLIGEFNSSLQNSQVLIIAGTSFRDIGITPSFNQFLNDAFKKKIVIIEPVESLAYEKIHEVFGGEYYFEGLIKQGLIMQVNNYPNNLLENELEAIVEFIKT